MLISVFDSEIPALPEYEGQAFDSKFLGGKGYGLWWMQQHGINVPPALIIPTTMCVEYMKKPKTVMKKLMGQFSVIEKFFKGHLGYMPLLSVRSGARVSMPGMMDTILNVGLTSSTTDEWIARLGGACVTDSENRLHHMYKDVVGIDCPDNLRDQLFGAVEAVFQSWNNDRAKFYRKMHNIPEDWGTAVVIQAMVFGNLNDQSCTGVLFTRNPDNGDGKVVGEFLVNAQGEDVVAGIRTPQNLSEISNWNDAVGQEILDVSMKLETLRRDVQDIEFTVQDGKLYLLQTRSAKRSARAAVKIAVDMAMEGLISKQEAVHRVSLKELDLAQQSILDPTFKDEPFAVGIPACSGVVSGLAVLSSEAAINCKEPCILVTQETTPDDIAGMNSAIGVLTMTGGATSHAAVVARGMNKPCVVGLSKDISSFVQGPTVISFDGATGRVWLGKVPVIDGSSNKDVQAFKEMAWEVFNGGKYVEAVEEVTPGLTKLLRLDDKLTLPMPDLLELVKSSLSKVSTLVLDLTNPTPEEGMFFEMFYPEGDQLSDMLAGSEKHLKIKAVRLLESELSSEEKQKIVLLMDNLCKTELTRLPLASTLEDLILADGELVWSGKNTSASDKVVGWKLKEGVKFSAIGKVSPGGTSYVSEAQMLASMLA